MRRRWLLLLALPVAAFFTKDYWLSHMSPFVETFKTGLDGVVAKLRTVPFIGPVLPEALSWGSIVTAVGVFWKRSMGKLASALKSEGDKRANSAVKSALAKQANHFSEERAALQVKITRLENDQKAYDAVVDKLLEERDAKQKEIDTFTKDRKRLRELLPTE